MKGGQCDARHITEHISKVRELTIIMSKKYSSHGTSSSNTKYIRNSSTKSTYWRTQSERFDNTIEHIWVDSPHLYNSSSIVIWFIAQYTLWICVLFSNSFIEQSYYQCKFETFNYAFIFKIYLWKAQKKQQTAVVSETTQRSEKNHKRNWYVMRFSSFRRLLRSAIKISESAKFWFGIFFVFIFQCLRSKNLTSKIHIIF